METFPFSKSQQLCRDFDVGEADTPKIASLPGHPYLLLRDLPQMKQFLDSEFCAKDLETLAPHLWVMSTYSSTNINSLHRQRVKGREIIIREEPRLHLVWYHNRILKIVSEKAEVSTEHRDSPILLVLWSYVIGIGIFENIYCVCVVVLSLDRGRSSGGIWHLI
ncbi:hypothetical protein EAF04_000901 [Stromatinia cepivora]|nr:hypothetical protein EAF04_000901 [Stromatinia cepivora]